MNCLCMIKLMPYSKQCLRCRWNPNIYLYSQNTSIWKTRELWKENHGGCFCFLFLFVFFLFVFFLFLFFLFFSFLFFSFSFCFFSRWCYSYLISQWTNLRQECPKVEIRSCILFISTLGQHPTNLVMYDWLSSCHTAAKVFDVHGASSPSLTRVQK